MAQTTTLTDDDFTNRVLIELDGREASGAMRFAAENHEQPGRVGPRRLAGIEGIDPDPDNYASVAAVADAVEDGYRLECKAEMVAQLHH